MIKIICAAILGAITALVTAGFFQKDIGTMHIESSNYGDHIWVSLTELKRAPKRYGRLRIERSRIPDEEHEKYILKEKE